MWRPFDTERAPTRKYLAHSHHRHQEDYDYDDDDVDDDDDDDDEDDDDDSDDDLVEDNNEGTTGSLILIWEILGPSQHELWI